jgi:hypothetical protein
MNDQDTIDRFEEIEAGRILGDLDPDEIKEWEKLSADPRCQADLSLELTAASLDAEFLASEDTTLPEGLLKALHGGISEFVTTTPEETKPDETVIVRPTRWQGLLASPTTAWSIAALFAVLFVANSLVEKAPVAPDDRIVIAPEEPSPSEARNTLISKAGDLVQSKFGGTEKFNQMSGTVVWSDELQEGYMSLSNLPANDPDVKQYQLWIVDPDRDEKPVDGGVFDISASDGTAIIPIRNPLVVTNPQAFVITLEQPGGVVVSKQEIVVALAKAS